MQTYSYDRFIRDNKGNIRKEYVERVAPVAKVPGVRNVVWDAEIGQHVTV